MFQMTTARAQPAEPPYLGREARNSKAPRGEDKRSAMMDAVNRRSFLKATGSAGIGIGDGLCIFSECQQHRRGISRTRCRFGSDAILLDQVRGHRLGPLPHYGDDGSRAAGWWRAGVSLLE